MNTFNSLFLFPSHSPPPSQPLCCVPDTIVTMNWARSDFFPSANLFSQEPRKSSMVTAASEFTPDDTVLKQREGTR